VEDCCTQKNETGGEVIRKGRSMEVTLVVVVDKDQAATEGSLAGYEEEV
jgi:hypothetical protein